jgi:hypothetical protein
VKTPEEQKELSTLKALASDISDGLTEIKHSSSNEKRAVYTAFKSLAFGDNINEAANGSKTQTFYKIDY